MNNSAVILSSFKLKKLANWVNSKLTSLIIMMGYIQAAPHEMALFVRILKELHEYTKASLSASKAESSASVPAIDVVGISAGIVVVVVVFVVVFSPRIHSLFL